MSVSYLPQPVITHKPTFVHMAIDTVDSSFGRVLPKGDIATINQNGLTLGILGNHYLVFVEFTRKIMIIEVGTGID